MPNRVPENVAPRMVVQVGGEWSYLSQYTGGTGQDAPWISERMRAAAAAQQQGLIHLKERKYRHAERSFFLALRLMLEVGRHSARFHIAGLYYALGTTYSQWGQFSLAASALTETKRIHEECGQHELAGAAILRLMSTAIRSNQPAAAEELIAPLVRASRLADPDLGEVLAWLAERRALDIAGPVPEMTTPER